MNLEQKVIELEKRVSVLEKAAAATTASISKHRRIKGITIALTNHDTQKEAAKSK